MIGVGSAFGITVADLCLYSLTLTAKEQMKIY